MGRGMLLGGWEGLCEDFFFRKSKLDFCHKQIYSKQGYALYKSLVLMGIREPGPR